MWRLGWRSNVKAGLLRMRRCGWLLLLGSCCTGHHLAVQAQSSDELRPTVFRLGESAGFFQFRPGSWGLVGAEVWNPTDEPVRLLATTTFAINKDVQYGREFWVPAQAKRKISYPIRLPDAIDPNTRRLELLSRLYDRTDGKDRLLRHPDDPMWHKSSLRVLHQKHITGYYPEPLSTGTGLTTGDEQIYKLVEPARDPVLEAIKIIRRAVNIKNFQHIPSLDVNDELPWPLALGSIDQLVLGGNRLATEPEAREAFRGWLNQGGRLWIMLDKTDLSTVKLLLGDAFPAYEVDRVSLSQYEIESVDDPTAGKSEVRDLEIPVELIRLMTEGVEVSHTVNDWPAAFWLKYGHGEILFTALELRGWSRPRREIIIRPRGVPGEILLTPPLEQVAARFFEESSSPVWSEEDFQQYIGEQIGYQIVAKEWVIGILGSFCAVILLAGLWLARVGHLERLLWIGPLAAICTAVVLGVLGKMSRESVPPTVAVAQWIAPVQNSQFVPVSGLAAIYNQQKLAEKLGVREGGVLWLERGQSEEASRRLVWTDHGKAQWENTNLPEGVQEATFQKVVAMKQPLAATASLSAKGLSGQFQLGPFKEVSDVLLVTPAGDRYQVHVEGNQFTSGPGERLKPGEFFGGSLIIEDEQRHRQQVLSHLLRTTPTGKRRFPRQPTLLAWSKPLEMGLNFPEQHQRLGSALLALPLALNPTPRGESFVVPPWLCRIEVTVGKDGSRASELFDNARQQWSGKNFDPRPVWLRVQLPKQVLPAQLTKVVVTTDVEFSGFDLEVLGVQGDEVKALEKMTNPVGTRSVAIDQRELLSLDADGGFVLVVRALPGEEQTEQGQRGKKYSWQVKDLYLVVHGERQDP